MFYVYNYLYIVDINSKYSSYENMSVWMTNVWIYDPWNTIYHNNLYILWYDILQYWFQTIPITIMLSTLFGCLDTIIIQTNSDKNDNTVYDSRRFHFKI